MPTTSSPSRSRRSPASRRSTIGGEQKPAIRIQVDPAKLAARGLTLEDVRGAARRRHHQRRQGHAQRPRSASFTIVANDQLTEAGQYDDVDHRLSQRRADPGARRRPRRSTAAEERLAAWANNTARRSCWSVFKQPGANVIERSTRSRGSCRASPRTFRRRSRSRPSLDRTETIRASVA